MKIIGLTGGIASGKSTVANIFRKFGVPVICTDELARAVVEPGEPAMLEIQDQFGKDVIKPDGTLDRIAVAALVFSSEVLRHKLESILHPRISDKVSFLLAGYRDEGKKVVVIDVPLLFESGWDEKCDVNVVVAVPHEIQIQRLIVRDKMTHEQAFSRLKAQMSLQEKKKRADFVIDNSGSIENTEENVKDVLKSIGYELLNTVPYREN